jgi:hypothetical protein
VPFSACLYLQGFQVLRPVGLVADGRRILRQLRFVRVEIAFNKKRKSAPLVGGSSYFHVIVTCRQGKKNAATA